MKAVEDAGLPGLATALDVDCFLDRLRRGLPECPEEIELVGGRIFDVQYAPGERGIVLYQLKLRERGGSRSRRQLLAVNALRPGDAPTPPREQALAHYRALQDPGLHTPYLPLPEDGLAAYAFPIDPGLRGLLEATDGAAVGGALRDLWGERGVRVHDVKARCLGYTPGARAALRYEVLAEDRATRAPELRHLVGKLHAHKRASVTFAKSWAAWVASNRRVPLAPPVGFLPDLDVSLQEHVDGERLGDLAGTATFGARLREAARALAIFHGLAVPVASRRSAEKEIAVVERWCATIASLRPDVSRRVGRLRDGLAARIGDAARVSAVVHGDFHPANVLVGCDGVKLIDLDQMARGDPLLDVGRFLASLRVSALRVSGDPCALDDAAAGFLERYLAHSGESEGRARLFEAACLLTAAGTGFRLQREGWQQHTEWLLDEAERVVSLSDAAGARESSLRPVRSHVDAARWHEDGVLAHALLDEPIRATYGAVATRCRVRRDRRGRHVRLQLSGRREGERWKATLEGIAGMRRNDADLEAWSRLREALASRPDAPRLPRLVAYLSPLELLVAERMPGVALARLIGTAEGPRVAERAGAALATLHAAPVVPARQRTVAAELQTAGRRVSQLGAARPELSARARALSDLAERRIEGEGETRDPVPGIARLGPEAILWDGCDVAFTRVGAFAAAHPALDLAETLARIAACDRGEGAGGGEAERLVSSLRSAYLEQSPIDPAVLAGFEALALLRMACRAAREGEGRGADALVGRAAQRLGEAPARDRRTEPGSPASGGPPPSPDRSTTRLWRTLARECRGRTAVFGPHEPELRGVLSRRGLSVQEIDAARADSAGDCDAASGDFDTLLVYGLLEHGSSQERRRWIRSVWQQLGPDGRLVVCVPNPDASPKAAGRPPLGRRRLRRLLRPLGRPKLVTGQPYRWLVMRVEAVDRPSPGVLERYRVIADLCRGRVLELGCGPGDLCAVIAERGHAVEGVDCNRQKIERARERLPGLRFTACDILDLDPDRERADTVVLSEVLEHVDEAVGNDILERAWSLIEPGGRLVVSVPNEDCVPHANHVREFDRAALWDLLAPLATPRICIDQPFRYLLMFVDRPGSTQ